MFTHLAKLLGRDESLGSKGERYAARWLRRRGYQVLHRNLRLGGDEADIVARAPDKSTIIIVEVKTRIPSLHPPEESVGRQKQYHLARFAARLARRSPYRNSLFRFDVIAIEWPADSKPVVRHYEGAFDSPF